MFSAFMRMPPVLSPLSSSSLVPRHARAKPPFPSPGRHKFWTGGDWQPKPDSTGLEFLAGANASAAVGEPTAISYGPNTLDVFYAHEQNGYHRSWNGNEWAPDSLYGDDLGTPGPGLASTIGAAAKGPGVATVVARASNGSVYQQYLDGDHWSGWEWLGGRHVGSPVVTFKGDQVHLFGVNAGNGQLHHKYWSPDTRKWTPSPRGWETLGGGPFTGGLAALSWGPDRLDVFAIGTDGALYQKYFQTDAYSDWISLGGSGLALQPQVLSPRPGAFEIIAARAGKVRSVSDARRFGPLSPLARPSSTETNCSRWVGWILVRQQDLHRRPVAP